jgi:catechol 2,3-dioxygenase-like lactoylglutathione lyase family enzyme
MTVLGLWLMKKPVNFDDPGTYHLYYGDEVGRPERQDSRDALEARDRDKPYSTAELDSS